MGTGVAGGDNPAEEAARMAISSPLLEDVSVSGAEAVLVNICGGKNLGLHTIEGAMAILNEAVGTDANVILGAVIDEELEDELRITVIATGFGSIPHEVPVRPSEKLGSRLAASFTETSRPRTSSESTVSVEQETEDASMPIKAQASEGAEVMTSDLIRDRWERSHSQARLDVPAYIRKQMD